MEAIYDFVFPRGEYASLVVVALLLALAAPRVARLTGLANGAIGDLYWNASLTFVVAGRLAYLATEAPSTLLDPLVIVRIQGGVSPLAGGAAVLAVLAWRLRAESSDARWRWLTAWVAGLSAATVGYDIACPLRNACYGAAAPAPLRFRMSGLADTRIATPLVEAALLLAVLGVMLTLWPRLRPGQAGLLTLSAIAGLRVAFQPLSVTGWPGFTAEVLVFGAVAVLALAAAIFRAIRSSRANANSSADRARASR